MPTPWRSARAACSRQRAERPLVRRELDHAVEAQLALDVLDRLAGLVRRQRLDARAEESHGYTVPLGDGAH